MVRGPSDLYSTISNVLTTYLQRAYTTFSITRFLNFYFIEAQIKEKFKHVINVAKIFVKRRKSR